MRRPQHRTVRASEELARTRVEAWSRAALEGALADLASTAGARNEALRDAAIKLGGLLRYGLIEGGQGEATRRLLAAAEANGYTRKDGEREARGVIRRGLTYGLEHAALPADIEELMRARDAPRPPPRPRRESDGPPPSGEVRALWARASSVLEVPDVAAYLERRGADVLAVADGDLARALPNDGADLPRWARLGRRAWSASGHRLLVALHDERGELRSMLARDVTGEAERKSLAPQGYARRGLAMACGLARQILETGARPPWWTGDAPRLRIVVAEGEIDFLVAASRIGDGSEHAPAVVGIVAGSWSEAIAARMPDGAELVIATDPDEGGERYARQIVESLAGRPVRLARWRAAA